MFEFCLPLMVVMWLPQRQRDSLVVTIQAGKAHADYAAGLFAKMARLFASPLAHV
jgi:hypothetical protein